MRTWPITTPQGARHVVLHQGDPQALPGGVDPRAAYQVAGESDRALSSRISARLRAGGEIDGSLAAGMGLLGLRVEVLADAPEAAELDVREAARDRLQLAILAMVADELRIYGEWEDPDDLLRLETMNMVPPLVPREALLAADDDWQRARGEVRLACSELEHLGHLQVRRHPQPWRVADHLHVVPALTSAGRRRLERSPLGDAGDGWCESLEQEVVRDNGRASAQFGDPEALARAAARGRAADRRMAHVRRHPVQEEA